jgi:XRE family transcriptional regulator, regulator of sulfur utilization
MGRVIVLWPIDTREVSQTLQARFGERVRKLRKARGWTQEEMAERFGIDRAYLSHVERGTKNICLPTMDILAKGFDISLARLLSGI